MAYSEETQTGLRFTWRVENFSMCPQNQNVPLQSPSFYMGTLDKTEWHLSLFPKGKSDDHIICDLFRENDSGPVNIKINYQFSFPIAEGVTQYDFKTGNKAFGRQQTVSQKLMKRTEIFEKKHLFLPRDTLTVRCHLWENGTDTPEIKTTPAVKALVECLYEGKTVVPEELYATTSFEVLDMKRKLYPYLNDCSARTRIGIERRCLTWPIKNVSSFKPDQKLSVPLMCNSKRVPPITLTISFKGAEGNAQIDIRKSATNEMGPIFVICRLAVLDINGREHFSSLNEKQFASPRQDEVWQFPSFFTSSQLIKSKTLCLPNDVLFLRCTFAISVGVEFSEMEEYNFASFPMETATDVNNVGTLTEDMKSFYIDRKLFDVELKIENQTFPAHKAVLALRSPVFCAMFEHDTVEKKTNAVNIPDVDANTLTRMLSFMYSDFVENLGCESAMKLYSAADKYQIISLKKICSTFLVSNLSAENVCEVLVLADIHQDKELRKAAQDLLFQPPFEALLSVEFENFISSSTQLARETLRDCILKLKSDLSLGV